MLYYINTWWRWLRRSGYCRGFGVQSPSAYSFIRYVVNEHYPYYAYQELREKLAQLGRREHKIGRLLLRLSNYWQPTVWCSNHPKYDAYLHAGCWKAQGKDLAECFCLSEQERSIILIHLDEMPMEAVVEDVLPHCNEQTMLVAVGNLHDRKTYRGWRKLQESMYSGITYDLYYVGIGFFDKKRFKQHYRVNF